MQIKEFRLPWWPVILVLMYFGKCAQTDSSLRLQRRFMWKQMDDTMDGLLDSMASGARAMKNMFGEFIPGMTTAAPPLVMHSNVLDYLPSDTTKVKYVIRGSSTHKPMKILKMSAPKKVVKIMTVPKAIVESKLGNTKLNFPSAEALRQLEREQEILAEGRVPQYDNEGLKDGSNIVKGQISEFGGEWRPVSTAKPMAMSELHTRIVSESLPEPEKIVYEPQANEVSYDYHKHQSNSYEVTEHTPEETVAVPYAAQTHYQNSRGFVPIKSTQHQTQPHHQNHQHHQQNARVGLPHSTSTTTTSTTESPNYPASYLKKQRERPLNLLQQHLKNLGVNDSDVALLGLKPKTTQKTQSFVRVKSESWPLLLPTILPTIAAPASTTAKVRKAEPLMQPTTDQHLRQKTTRKPANYKPQDKQQRGSIKFGDKLTELY